MLRIVAAKRVAAASALVATLVLGACGESDEPGRPAETPPPAPARAADFPKPEGRTLTALRRELGPGPVLAPSVSLLEPGTDRFGFALFDRRRKQIADAPVALYIAPKGGGKVRGPFTARFESLAVEPEHASQSTTSDPDAARSLYVAELPFDRAGEYEVLGVVKLDDQLVAAESVYPDGRGLSVREDRTVPDVGDPAPRTSTPTVESVGGAVEKIDTRVPPSTMHEEDFADVVGKRPAVLVFATPALCMSRVCGPVVDVAEQVKARHEGDAAFIHMEIYRDNEVEKGFRPQVLEWGLPTEPWVFTVDQHGKIAARLEGAFSARELEDAVEAATRS